jgi:HEAT repeat protein
VILSAHILLLGCLSWPADAAEPSIPLREGVSAPLDEAFEALKEQLRERDKVERNKAVRGLAELGTVEAWLLVLECLEDPLGRVSDQAQLELAELPPQLAAQLLGKAGLESKKELVPLRAAEILGRLPLAQAEKDLIQALRHKDPDVRRSLLWSVERLAERELLSAANEDLVQAVTRLAQRDKFELVRAQALVTLRDLDPAATGSLVREFTLAASIPMRVAAVELLELLPADEALVPLEEALADPAWVVRLRACEALARRGDLAGLRRLIAALGAEPALRSRWRIVGLLRELSGLKYGLDSRSWEFWLTQLPADWTRADKHVPQALGGEQTASFVGMPVLSERLSFLIDFSGSMWMERDGESRKQRVDGELRRALEGLEDSVAFNVHPYYDVPLRWQKQLTPAKPKNVQQALAYFETCRAYGTGDFWAAAMEAMEDPQVDTLMVLTDGAPTGGRRWNLELMVALFRHENRFRGVALDVLLFDAPRGLTRYWTKLCDESGGRWQDVEL